MSGWAELPEKIQGVLRNSGKKNFIKNSFWKKMEIINGMWMEGGTDG